MGANPSVAQSAIEKSLFTIGSWTKYTQRNELINFINENIIKNVFVLSGDIHSGAIYYQSGIIEINCGSAGSADSLRVVFFPKRNECSPDTCDKNISNPYLVNLLTERNYAEITIDECKRVLKVKHMNAGNKLSSLCLKLK